MIRPRVKAKKESDVVGALERKMVRVRALLNELKRILDAEYVAGMNYDQKSLKKLILRKQNSVKRFEHLACAMGGQLDMMADPEMPSCIPRNLVNLVKMIPGLTSEQKDVLLPLARDLEQNHLALMKTARRNGVMFKTALNRMSATSKYVNQENVRTL